MQHRHFCYAILSLFCGIEFTIYELAKLAVQWFQSTLYCDFNQSVNQFICPEMQ